MLRKSQKLDIMTIMLLLGILAALIWILKNAQNTITLILLFVFSMVIAVYRGLQLRSQTNPKGKVKQKQLQEIKVLRLASWFKDQLLGHEDIIEHALKIVDRNISIFRQEKLLSRFLICGPTGVGKTYFSELLAIGIFGQNSLVLIPMANFQQASNVNTIYEAIVDKLKTHTHFVLLLDEIDRAHPAVRESMLHYLDTGEIMMPETGEKFRTPGVILVATTNAGEQDLDSLNPHQALEKSGKFDRAFLARFDAIFAFKKLTTNDTAKVVIKYLQDYYKTHGLQIKFMEPEVLIELIKANKEYEAYGLRHLINVIQTKTDESIYQAKRKGITRLKLSVEAGEIRALPLMRKKS